MVADGRSYFLCYGSAWLLLLSLHEASGCRPVVHGRAGGTVEISSCLPGNNVTFARWTYQGSKVASSTDGVVQAGRFAGRVDLDGRDFNLTLRAVSLADSGNFSFVSAVNDQQRDTVQVTLRVHEVITAKPTVSVNASWWAANRSCSVLLRCSASASEGPLAYEWRVGNRSLSGPRHRLSVAPQGVATQVTCTVSNRVSAKSASASVTCANDTADVVSATDPMSFTVKLSVAAGAFCLLVLVAAIVAVDCHRRRRRRRSSRKFEEATVYADIGDMAPNYVREPRGTAPLDPVQTVYDELRPGRMAL
ncbi:uncharacterized protein si:cabz01074944.1 isoform X2 [Syngnathus scovelli]|uniref:uncharacterized protein si:cabz01074944.1 isoform X2 n=1 Tax=Syngnathus scovelli TaxID=161590 RepID=UPI002110DDD9|nr:uncharacterized protein LOC125975514 isoform X2 [Syngnathus scovelli]